MRLPIVLADTRPIWDDGFASGFGAGIGVGMLVMAVLILCYALFVHNWIDDED